MPRLSADQCRTLADRWSDYAAALDDYEQVHLGQPDLDAEKLAAWIASASDAGRGFSEAAMTASFDDADAACATIADAMALARTATADLAGRTRTWGRCETIATMMFKLAATVADPAAGILGAAGAVVNAAS